MTNEMIERIAIALFVAEFGGIGWPRDLPEPAKERWRKFARIAVENLPSPWQTIETAPRDGTRVLLVDMASDNAMEPEIVIGAWDGKEWRDDQDIGCAGQYDYEPTHWMPPPSPPRS